MREIKFRAWDKKYNEMVRVSMLDTKREHGDSAIYIVDQTKRDDAKDNVGHYPQDYELMQYTGLKDSTKWKDLTEEERTQWIKGGNRPSEWKGKKVYEGDIVDYLCAEYHDPEISSTPDIIDSGQGEIYYLKYSYEIKGAEFPPDCYELRIIGNIYESPELLENK